MPGSDSHWTELNLINRLGIKKHLKRQLIMFYMMGNVTQNQNRGEFLDKYSIRGLHPLPKHSLEHVKSGLPTVPST